MRVRSLRRKTSVRPLSGRVRRRIFSALKQMHTPVWPIIARFTSGNMQGGIKRPPFDVPQAWMNHVLKELLIADGFNAEVDPFSQPRPNQVLSRPSDGEDQAIDFEIKMLNGNRHVSEVEMGNVASMFRSIHKICMAMEEDQDCRGILIVPNHELIGRCDTPSAMSSSRNARILISEWSYYSQIAASIHIIEFSTDTTVDLQSLNPNPEFWRGNWNTQMQQYLEANLQSFLK